jgi:hypothetical protein
VDVGEHEIHAVGPEHLQRLFRMARLQSAGTEVLELQGQNLADLLFVVDDQDRFACQYLHESSPSLNTLPLVGGISCGDF